MLHLEKEIFEQPAVLEKLAQNQAAHIAGIAEEIRRKNVSHIVLAARGTSDNAATYGRYLLESLAGIVVSLAAPSLFTLYKDPPRLDQSLVIGISQSGESTDIIQVIEEANRQDALTLAITNDGDSPLAESPDHLITLEAGEERSVAATKTYTAELMALAFLTAHLSQNQALLTDLERVPGWVEETLNLCDVIHSVAERYRYMEELVVLGRGYNYATAFETALKLKETCYLGTQPYSTADFRHGPIAVVEGGFPAWIIGTKGPVLDDVLDCAKELVEKNAELIAVSDQPALLDLARTPLKMPSDVPEWVSPIPYVVPGQLFALFLSVTRGYNPDQPRGLHKVTRTI
jgi:glucosamine--fructose-6-phosphate aminotransferase (isomerizing)